MTARVDSEDERVYRITFSYVRRSDVPDQVIYVALKQSVRWARGEYRCLRDLIRLHGSRLNNNTNITRHRLVGALAQEDENPWLPSRIEQRRSDERGSWWFDVHRNLTHAIRTW